MPKDFTYCLNDLAALLSVRSVDALPPNEAQQVRSVLSDAYRECFIRPDGSRSRWAERPVSLLVRAPTDLTVTLTEGSTLITSPSVALPASEAGSTLVIAGMQFEYAGETSAGADHLADAWPMASGTYAATLYHSCLQLPVGAVDVLDDVTILGGDALEYLAPDDGRPMPTGTPTHYRVDPAILTPGDEYPESLLLRLRLFPLPDAAPRTIHLTVSIAPAGIPTDPTDLPMLPAAAVDDVLLPIARAKLVAVAKRYTGANKGDLMAAAAIAQRKLDTLTPASRARTASIGLADGW